MSKWIKKGDLVLVLAGNEKGKTGEVLSRKKDRVLVQGINIRKKHMKQRSQEVPSDIVSIEVPIHISNVAICDKDGKKLKLKFVSDEKGTKSLCYDKDSKTETYRTLKKPAKVK